MARATWSGSVQFGMVSIPVKMYTAMDSAAEVKFNEINALTGNRVGRKRVDAVTGDEVAYEDIVKGYEVAKGQYVTFTEAELDSIAPEKNSVIDIIEFVDADQINPMYYDTPYYLGSDRADKPYALLNAAMTNANKVAVAKYVARSKEHLCVLSTKDGGLVLNHLRWAEQMRSIEADTDLKPPRIELTAKEIEMATALVESLVEDFDATEFVDEHNVRVLDAIGIKAEGKVLTVTEVPEVKATEDLLAALEGSITAAKAAHKKKAKSA